jgi:hypothetical protein
MHEVMHNMLWMAIGLPRYKTVNGHRFYSFILHHLPVHRSTVQRLRVESKRWAHWLTGFNAILMGPLLGNIVLGVESFW